MKAYVTSYNEHEDITQIQLGDHKFELGGQNGDSYCYSHQSFECWDSLSDEELEAINSAEKIN